MAAGTRRRVASGSIFSYRVYNSGRTECACSGESGCSLHDAVSLSRRDAIVCWQRSEAPRCGDRVDCRAPHMGTEPDGSSSPALYSAGRRHFEGRDTMDRVSEEVLFTRPRALTSVSRKVPGELEESVRGWKVEVCGNGEGVREQRGVSEAARSTVYEGMGGVRKKTVRRARASAGISR